ncbi:hypothetical protein DFQ26_003827 [Actinomortierella ambigua]|nr:hypothetical protein DFQ26_003827 [Actinomortierella ambigua]
MSIWFDGPVVQAVGEANSKQCLLLVCLLQGNDEANAQYEARFSEDPLVAELAGLNLVALKVLKDSQDGALFGQIYPIMSLPAVYLIRNGLLADFLPAQVEPAQMLERIQKAVQGHFAIPPPPGTLLPTTGTGASSSTTPPPTAPVPTVSSAPPVPTQASQPPVATAVFPSEASPLPASPSPSSSSPAITTTSTSQQQQQQQQQQDTLQKLKQKQEERRVQREKEEREAEKKRELERRANSKALQDARAELKDKEAKKIKDQLEREKREEAEYRKKLKQQLEEDKQRRKAEREKERERLEAAKRAAAAAGEGEGSVVTTTASSTTTTTTTTATTAQRGGFGSGALSPPLPRQRPSSAYEDNPQVVTPSEVRQQNSGLWNARNDASSSLACESTRLNIRLFDGSSIRNVFQATDALSVVRQWIDQNRGEDETPYNIVQVIPPRMFTDEEKTLRDLDLCPSATLVLKPIVRSTSAYGGSGSGAVTSLMGLGWSALSLAGKAASAAYNTVSYYNPLQESGTSNSSNPHGPSSSSPSPSSARAKKDDDDRDKHRTTYNGNSTSLE